MHHPDLATLAATALVSIAIGFGAATLMPSREQPHAPIIEAQAWEAKSPPPAIVQPVRVAAPRCSEWAISDVAMEGVLDEMIRRGWRPPTQGEAIATLEVAQTVGLAAVDPSAPMPQRGIWNAGSPSAGDDGSEQTPLTNEAAEEPATEAQSLPPPA